MIKTFEVICHNCGKRFEVLEEETKFPKKEKYFCCRSCANTRHHSKETKNKIKNGVKNSPAFIEGMEKRYNHKLYQLPTSICVVCGKEFHQKYIETDKGIKITAYKTCSQECRSKRYSYNNKKNHTGGYREGSVKNYKSGWYKNFYCDSSWELAFVIYHLDNNLYIERNKSYLEYNYNGEIHKFYPDFITDEGLIEIKGYHSKQSEAKLKECKSVKFIFKNDMKKYLDYVIDTYGENFTELYENKNGRVV